MLAQCLTQNVHVDYVTERLGPLSPRLEFVPPDIDFLVLLYTNRCGSNFLAHALASTGRFNEAGEFFNGNTIVDHARAHGLASVQSYLGLLPRLIGWPKRITVKMGIEHLDLLEQAGILQPILPRCRFILLERRDQLAQAISRAIALQTLWWTTEHQRRLPDDQLVYDRAVIKEELARTALGNRQLYAFIRTAGVAPLHFYYERLVKAPQAHMDEVAAWLAEPGLVYQPSLVRIRKQANAVNDEWRRRYLAPDQEIV